MICPRCRTETIEMENNSVKLDVCFNGCGGIWFDQFELKKLDEKHEADPAFVAQLSESENKSVSLDEPVECPVCESQKTMRHFWSVERKVEVDECPACGGFWLDAGEFTHIHSLFSTEAEKKAAANELFDATFGGQLAEMEKESQEKLEKARKIAKAFRFICPSYYIPGKQDGGAF